MSASQYRIVETTIADKLDGELAELCIEHWDEIVQRKDLLPLAFDTAKYAALEQMGCLISLVAYDTFDEPVGYSTTLVGEHLHHKHVRYAQNDLLFVAKEHRNNGLGGLMLSTIRARARDRGAQLICWATPPGSALADVMNARHTPVQDVVFREEL